MRPLIARTCALLTLAANAHAVVDFDSSSPATLAYARETLSSSSTTKTVEDNEVLYNVQGAGTDLNAQTRLGAGIAAGDRVYLRFDFENGAINPESDISLTVNGSSNDIIRASGGSVGESFVVYVVSAPAGLAASDPVALSVDAVAIPSQGAVNLHYAAYESLTAAIYLGEALYTNSVFNYVGSVAGAAATFTPDENTAEVSTGFTEFSSASAAPRRARVGALQYAVESGVLAANDGAPANLSEIANQAASEVTLRGDFSYGTWFLDNDADCATPDLDLSDTIAEQGFEEITVALTGFGSSGFNNLCVEVDGANDVIIADEYSADGEPLPSNLFPVISPPALSGTLGRILRNGTVIQLPSLSVYAEYNQMVSIVNYRDTAVDYEFEFIAEEDINVTPLDVATGTLQPSQKLVIPVSDLVAIDGGNRCAAVFSALAPVGSIGLATTVTNLSDGSTDTVVYAEE